MKKTGIILLLAALLFTCQKLKKDPVEQEQQVETEQMVSDSVEVIETRTHYASELDYLVDHQGAYAGQEKLFEKDQLAERMKNLEGFNYEVMLEFWNTETPVAMEGDVLHMSGCRANDCPGSAYDFFVDLANDNINVFHFRNNMLRIYQEKGWIELPEGFANEMEVKKSNAGIGNPDVTESNYSLTVDSD